MTVEEYDGHPVEAVTVAITKAGDGLSSELEVAPVAHPHGADVFYVLHGVVGPVSYDDLPKRLRKGSLVLAPGDAMVRKEKVVTQAITEVSKADVEDFLAKAQERVKRAQEDASGILRMATDAEDTVALQNAHDGGLHPEAVEGCPACDPDSAAAAEAEGSTSQGKRRRARAGAAAGG